jgi:hypothetical protein
MERDDILMLLRELSEGLLTGEIKPSLYARTVDGLISSNLDVVGDLELLHLWIADYGVRGAENPPSDADLGDIARKLIALAQGPPAAP